MSPHPTEGAASLTIDDALAREHALIVAAVPAPSRGAAAALLRLDRRLGDVLRTTREPLIGQMRLAWWRDAVARAGAGRPAPAEPLLRAIEDGGLIAAIGADALPTLIDGWDALVGAERIDAVVLERVASSRGATVASALARLCGGGDARIGAAGRGWALADLAVALSDPAAAAIATDMARAALAQARGYWPRRLRSVGALAVLGRETLKHRRAGDPGRTARLLRFRLTGL